MPSWLLPPYPALLPDHQTPKCPNSGGSVFPGGGRIPLLRRIHFPGTQSCCDPPRSLGPLFLLPGPPVAARRGKSLQLKHCRPEQWAKHSPHKSPPPHCFWDLHPAVCKAAAQRHDENYLLCTMKYLVNAALRRTVKRNSCCFYWVRSNRTMVTKLCPHRFLVRVIADAEGRHYTCRQLEKQLLLCMEQLDCCPIFMDPNCLHFIIPPVEEKVQ